MAQVNAHVGEISANAAMILDWSAKAAEAGADLVLFPEMCLTGYPVEDLALRATFVEASRTALEHLAGRLAERGLGELAVVVGYLDRADDTGSGSRGLGQDGTPKPQNAAAVLHRGQIVSRAAKHHLPNYGVFDEYRYFAPGDVLQVIRVRGVDVAIAICEDLWQDGGPVAATREAGAGLLAVINASPYEEGKDDARDDLVGRRAQEAGCPLAYVNLVGGQDELVFDGYSVITDAQGAIVHSAVRFTESLEVVDLDLPAAGPMDAADSPDSPQVTDPGPSGMVIQRTEISAAGPDPEPRREPGVRDTLDSEEQVYRALVLGLRDYLAKNGLQRVYLGLSGGIDSTLVAAIACDAIGAENVHGISNPSVYSTEHSKTDAADLARRTGLNLTTVPIAPIVDAYHGQMEIDGVAAENLQARIRANIWLARSNADGPSIVLACGNKSELAVGYSTIYGDAVGGFAPIKDVLKTQVWELARWRNAEAERRGETPPIPENTITKEPSAELRPDQKDTDSLPPYDVLDGIIDDYVEGDQGRDHLLARGFEPALVDRITRMVDRAEYKRRQYPPGTKISFKAFGRDRRLPITNGWREGGKSAG